MSLAIVEQISAAIETRLETITTDNGYSLSVSEVVRPTRIGGVSPKDKQIVLRQGNWKPPGEQESASNSTTKVQIYYVTCWVRSSDKATTAVDTEINQLAADVEKALMSDDTFGGLAIMSDLTGGIALESDDGQCEGITLLLEVQYRCRWGDPYTQM